MDESLLARLGELGLTRNEAQAWLCLLESEDSRGLTGYEVAARSGIPRSAVYAVLRRLEDSGGAFRSGDGPARYVAVSPDRFLDGLKRRHEARLLRLQADLARLPPRSLPEPVWVLPRYEQVMERAEAMVRTATRSLWLSVWRRELERLGPALDAAAARPLHRVLHCLDEPGPAPPGFSLWVDGATARDPRKQAWSHKIIVVADREEALLGGAEPLADNHAVWTRNPSLVDLCTNHVILDVTLLARDRGEDPATDVGPMMRPHLPPAGAAS